MTKNKEYKRLFTNISLHNSRQVYEDALQREVFTEEPEEAIKTKLSLQGVKTMPRVTFKTGIEDYPRCEADLLINLLYNYIKNDFSLIKSFPVKVK